jgi:hypothetical protein
MSYTHQLSKLAREIESHICFEYDKEKNLYKVWVHLVVFKDSLGGRKNIHQLGYTIEDGCYGIMVKARGGYLENFMNDKAVKVL